VATIKKRIAGKLAKTRGELFESRFESQCRFYGVTCVPIPDSCKVIGANKIIRVFSPFDYVIGYGNRAGFVDTKTVLGGGFTYSMIHQKQVESLGKLTHCGVSGYVINLSGKVYFVSVEQLREVRPRSSIDFDSALFLGNETFFDIRMMFE
jgi:hypothetical protein